MYDMLEYSSTSRASTKRLFLLFSLVPLLFNMYILSDYLIDVRLHIFLFHLFVNYFFLVAAYLLVSLNYFDLLTILKLEIDSPRIIRELHLCKCICELHNLPVWRFETRSLKWQSDTLFIRPCTQSTQQMCYGFPGNVKWNSYWIHISGALGGWM